MRRSILAAALVAAEFHQQASAQKPIEDALRDGAVEPEIVVTSAPPSPPPYAYGFRLPANRIAAAQEKHVRQCEALGPARCSVVATDYHVAGRRAATAKLELKLAPDVARAFASTSIATVVEAGGMLTDAVVKNSGVAERAAAMGRSAADVAGERDRVARQRDRPGLMPQERVQLQERQQDLEQARHFFALAQTALDREIPSTPVTYTYRSGETDAGFGDGPVRGAVRDGWANIVKGTLLLITWGISLAPIAILAVALGRLWRRPRRVDPRDD